MTVSRLEPISKSPEEDNEASELYKAEEVLGVVFPTDEDAALPLNPSKEALHEPASHIAAYPIDQNPWAHWRSPMDMMRQG